MTMRRRNYHEDEKNMVFEVKDHVGQEHKKRKDPGSHLDE